MAIFELDGHRPRIAASSYVAPSAYVIGRVTIGERVFIAPGAVIRGDMGTITVGDGTNIQDHCILHPEEDDPVVLGKNNHVGHRAIIHCATIGDGCLIGMGSIILDRSQIGDRCIIAAGALVTKETRIPSGKLVMGIPAKIRGEATEAQLAEVQAGALEYQGLIDLYKSFKQID